MDRLFEAMGLVKNDLKPEFKEFLEIIEDVDENVNYLDYNDFVSWRGNPSTGGLEKWVKQRTRKFLKRK